MRKKLSWKIVAFSGLMLIGLAACGSGSSARIADQVDTATSFASEDGGNAQMSFAMSEFASSFGADFAALAGAHINAAYEGYSANVAASIDVFGGGFDSASVAAEDAASDISASFEDPDISSSLNAYKQAFATAYAAAYAAEYNEAASLAADVVDADLGSSLSADIAGLDEGYSGTSADVNDGGNFSASVEQAYSSAIEAASFDLPDAGSSNSSVLWLGSLVLLGAGFAIGQIRKK